MVNYIGYEMLDCAVTYAKSCPKSGAKIRQFLQSSPSSSSIREYLIADKFVKNKFFRKNNLYSDIIDYLKSFHSGKSTRLQSKGEHVSKITQSEYLGHDTILIRSVNYMKKNGEKYEVQSCYTPGGRLINRHVPKKSTNIDVNYLEGENPITYVTKQTEQKLLEGEGSWNGPSLVTERKLTRRKSQKGKPTVEFLCKSYYHSSSMEKTAELVITSNYSSLNKSPLKKVSHHTNRLFDSYFLEKMEKNEFYIPDIMRTKAELKDGSSIRLFYESNRYSSPAIKEIEVLKPKREPVIIQGKEKIDEYINSLDNQIKDALFKYSGVSKVVF